MIYRKCNLTEILTCNIWKVVSTQIHKNQGASLHDKCLATSLQYIMSQIHDIARWICCQKCNKCKNGNTSKLTKSSNYLYKCDIFSKIIWKHALIIACTVGLSFKTNSHNIYSITQNQARQQIPQTIVDFSKICAIFNCYSLILYQVNINNSYCPYALKTFLTFIRLCPWVAKIKGRMCKFTISETIHNTATMP